MLKFALCAAGRLAFVVGSVAALALAAVIIGGA